MKSSAKAYLLGALVASGAALSAWGCTGGVADITLAGDAGLPGDSGADATLPDGAPVPEPQCDGGMTVPPIASWKRIFAGLSFSRPVDVVTVGDRFYVVEQGGALKTFRRGDLGATTALDLTARIVSEGEAGLLGVAFDPAFAQTGHVYLSFTAPHPTVPTPAGVVFQSLIARYTSTDGGRTLDPTSETIILAVDQPFANHNGGQLRFGPDGMLYLGLGDGGSGGDPLNLAQNKSSLLGKILRLDVKGGSPYAIPPSNPFAKGGGAPEIFAMGLRNPWRWSFDAPTGDLWVGDVGQSAREEIDKVFLGGNYGWRVREGKTCYEAATCATTGLIDPVHDYGRDLGQSVTGGYVYRGTAVPAVTGKYVFGDFASRRIWALDPLAPDAPPRQLDASAPFAVSSFGLDERGELLALDYLGGAIMEMVPGPAPEPCP